MDPRLVVLPVVGALIGWLTNYLAIKMIFRPRRPIRLLGLTLQGLIPRRRAELARNVGEVVEQDLISHDDVAAALSHPEMLASLRPRLEFQVDKFIRQKVIRDSFLLRAAFSTDAIAKLKRRLVDELMDSLPEIIDDATGELKKRLRFGEIVQGKIEAFELERLESVVSTVAATELKAIEILGGIIGFLVGFVQVGILALLD